VEEGELAAVSAAGVEDVGGVADQAGCNPQPHVDDKRKARISELMVAHGEAVFGFCMRMLRDEATALDVLQQTFLEAYRDLDQFAERAQVSTWLTGIARHRCLDQIKKDQRRRKWIESNDEAVREHVDLSASPGERIDRARLLAALDECIGELPANIRATVLERFHQGFTYEELSRSLGASANTLQVRVARALRTLKDCLERQGWDHE
jgi:RNA polymerase sigma-70 factor, ECF subfamily